MKIVHCTNSYNNSMLWAYMSILTWLTTCLRMRSLYSGPFLLTAVMSRSQRRYTVSGSSSSRWKQPGSMESVKECSSVVSRGSASRKRSRQRASSSSTRSLALLSSSSRRRAASYGQKVTGCDSCVCSKAENACWRRCEVGRWDDLCCTTH